MPVTKNFSFRVLRHCYAIVCFRCSSVLNRAKSNSVNHWFLVLQMRQGELNFCLGEDMYEAHKAGKEMPLAADIDAEVDSVELQRLKGIINRATVFDPRFYTAFILHCLLAKLLSRSIAHPVFIVFFRVIQFCLHHALSLCYPAIEWFNTRVQYPIIWKF